MFHKSSILWEVFRKTVHLSGLSIVVGYTILFHFFSANIAILVMTALLLILLEIEYIRIEHRPRIAAMFDGAFRKHEKDNISGAAFLVISCIICFSAFNYWIAVLALFMTVFGDLFAAIFGRMFGKTKLHNNKTFIGTFAGLSANYLVGLLTIPGFLLVTVPMALIATATELLTNKLDDNLTVPLFSGFAGQMIVFYMELDLPPVDFTFLGLF